MLHGHPLLTLAAVLVQGFKLFRIEGHQLVRVLERHVAPLEGLVGKSGAFKTFERRIMRTDHLHRQHALRPIRRLQAFIKLQSPQDPLMFRVFAGIHVKSEQFADLVDLLGQQSCVADLKYFLKRRGGGYLTRRQTALRRFQRQILFCHSALPRDFTRRQHSRLLV